jgi:hypothetical protein
MRLHILAGSAALLLANGLPPARGSGEGVRLPPVAAGSERPGTGARPRPAAWLWGLVQDRLTVPLGQAERMDWPAGGA